MTQNNKSQNTKDPDDDKLQEEATEEEVNKINSEKGTEPITGKPKK